LLLALLLPALLVLPSLELALRLLFTVAQLLAS
jgi:hypothetical protein